jgi:hypothetical protein
MTQVEDLKRIKESFDELINISEQNRRFKDHYESVYEDGVLDSKTKR